LVVNKNEVLLLVSKSLQWAHWLCLVGGDLVASLKGIWSIFNLNVSLFFDHFDNVRFVFFASVAGLSVESVRIVIANVSWNSTWDSIMMLNKGDGVGSEFEISDGIVDLFICG
jgi:hypothetical protein